MRASGVLAQFDSPQRLLAEPVDDFVATFIGRDRGYRALSFLPADDLPVYEVPTVPVGDAGPGSQWRLAVDVDGRPRGWLDPAQPDGTLRPGGSLHRWGGPMRTALDAALSSPSGLGVVVDADGAAMGGVCAEDVLAAWRRRRAADAH